MLYSTLITIKDISANLGNPDWAIFDCHFLLDDADAGRRTYLETHIPGAIYVHLDKDLSGKVIPGKTSRHPLPDIDTFSATLSNWGIDETVQVVAYDDRGGSIAARLWWMMQWVGHQNTAVLDGNFTHWLEAGFPTKSGVETRSQRSFKPQPNPNLLVDANQIMAMRKSPDRLIIDSRASERYRGELEVLDPIAGHIPGAVNAFYGDNLDEDGHFKSKEHLSLRFKEIFGDIPAEKTIFYCGSGVTAAHNILAIAHAGLGNAVLYPGSWSEWITDPNRPVVKK
jgi:thiosulfate/3-mercaptopyruvate sulfurtransferase